MTRFDCHATTPLIHCIVHRVVPVDETNPPCVLFYFFFWLDSAHRIARCTNIAFLMCCSYVAGFSYVFGGSIVTLIVAAFHESQELASTLSSFHISGEREPIYRLSLCVDVLFCLYSDKDNDDDDLQQFVASCVYQRTSQTHIVRRI